MALTVSADPTPLSTDEHGVVRVGGTRVTLDLVINPFLEGVTAEEIAMRYDGLDLSAVYGTIAYYLNHREEVDAYLREQAMAAEKARAEYGEALDARALRERLRARQDPS